MMKQVPDPLTLKIRLIYGDQTDNLANELTDLAFAAMEAKVAPELIMPLHPLILAAREGKGTQPKK